MSSVELADQIKRARRHRGWSQARLLQAMREHAKIEGVELMNSTSLRVALSRWENGHHRPDGLHARLLAIALDTPEIDGGGDPQSFRHTRARLAELDLSAEDRDSLIEVAGTVVELEQRVSIDIGIDGWSTVAYDHTLFNMTGRPLNRLVRELWFEHTQGPLDIRPTTTGMTIERVHDTSNLAKFACTISPPVEPGETRHIGYSCTGGQFVSDHYWRQSLPRYTNKLDIQLRHNGIREMLACTATEEHPDGAESSADADLVHDLDSRGLVMSIIRTRLRPNQAVTLRWDARHDAAG